MKDKEFQGWIEKIGDQYFSIVPEDIQNKRYPYCVDIWDAECETIITICAETEDSRDEAKALVKVLNYEGDKG